MRAGRHIQDNNGNVRMSSNTGGWEKFKVLDAGGGKVYLQSHRGAYLAIREDKNWGSLECKVTLYEDRNCRGGSRVERSTDSSGQTFGPYGRRRRRRRYVYISDARAERERSRVVGSGVSGWSWAECNGFGGKVKWMFMDFWLRMLGMEGRS
eukprot:g30563.t1